MAISLKKGGNVSLTKEDAGLKQLLIGLGWDVRATDGAAFDLDAMAFCLGADGKVYNGESNFIFFNNLSNADGTVKHTGDNRTGEGEGDDETLIIDLVNLKPDIQRVAIAVTIYQAEQHNQNFGQVESAFIRCVNNETGTEIARFDLSEDASTETAMIFGEVYRHNGEWKFKAIGQGYQAGFQALVESYGVTVK